MQEERKNSPGTSKIILLCAIFLFIASITFTGINVSYMRNCELNCYKTTATVTKLTTMHVQGRVRYYLSYTYTTEGGGERVVQGKSAFTKQSFDPKKIYVGETVEIYVDLDKNEAMPVTSVGNFILGADVYSIVSAVLFALAAVMYVVGSAVFLHEKGRGLKFRLLITWLPLALICVVSVLLFWAGLPTGTFAELFKNVGGAIGYAVIAGVTCIAAAMDALISKKISKKV